MMNHVLSSYFNELLFPSSLIPTGANKMKWMWMKQVIETSAPDLNAHMR